MSSSVRIIEENEVQIIHDLAHRIWPNTFKDILSEEQIAYMLNRMYAIDILQDQIARGHQFIVWEEDRIPIAFVGIERNYPVNGTLRIHKIYILPEKQGLGLGKKLIDEVKEIGLTEGFSSLNLNVNRFNNAVDFYKYIGFQIVKTEDIDIGNGYLMEDYVMELRITD